MEVKGKGKKVQPITGHEGPKGA